MVSLCRFILLSLAIFLGTTIGVEASEIDAEEAMAQIPSVNRLSDVQPTDWAYEALRSLVERYACIIGDPKGIFGGNRTLSRHEFAAGLNACIQKVESLINTNKAIVDEDLQKLQRLARDFERELVSLDSRLINLENRVAFLEDHNFSTTTKLDGIVNFVFTGSSGEGDNQVVFQHRPRLTFNTSFTGRDLLIVRIAGGNSTIPELAGGTSEVVQANQWYGDFDNSFFVVTTYYLFPINDKLLALVTPVGGLHADYAYPPVNPYFEDFNGGTTTLSAFAQRNQISSLGGGTGVALVYQLSDSLSLGTAYYGGQAFSSEEGRGLFNGNYSTGAHLKWEATEEFTFGLNYIHGFFPEETFGFGDNSRSFGLPNYSGTAVVNDTLAQFPTVTNSYGAEFFWQAHPKFGVGAWVGLVKARAIGVGDGEIWNYALSFVFPDLGQERNLGAIILGAQPYLASLEGVERFENDTPFHIEIFYKHQMMDNISVTSGLIWHPAPNQNANNEDIVTGTLRTTFTF
ncbi:MAG: iron uptake porin [Cyanobacteria bacterium P01_G01_bin.19]